MLIATLLAVNGAATWYNPAWWFFRVSYGSKSFVQGLTHAVRASVHFDAHVNATLNELVPERRALAVPQPENDGGAAWDLFADRAALEARMTERVRDNILNVHGLSVPSR